MLVISRISTQAHPIIHRAPDIPGLSPAFHGLQEYGIGHHKRDRRNGIAPIEVIMDYCLPMRPITPGQINQGDPWNRGKICLKPPRDLDQAYQVAVVNEGLLQDINVVAIGS